MLQWSAPQRTLDGKYRILISDTEWPKEAGLGVDFPNEKSAKLATDLVRAFDHYTRNYYTLEKKEETLDKPKKSAIITE